MPPEYRPDSAYHRARRRFAPSAIACMEAALLQFGRPASFLDIGCGEGSLVAWGRAEGLDAWGVDLAVTPAEGLLPWDLCEPLDLRRQFEWVLCWEVAEHLPERVAEILCDSLVRHVQAPTGRLLFTAARPGQRGVGHINCQPPDYWRALFTMRGLTWLAADSRVLSQTWRRVAPLAPWYGNNLAVYAWA